MIINHALFLRVKLCHTYLRTMIITIFSSNPTQCRRLPALLHNVAYKLDLTKRLNKVKNMLPTQYPIYLTFSLL